MPPCQIILTLELSEIKRGILKKAGFRSILMNSLRHRVQQQLLSLLPQPKIKHPLINSYGQIESNLSLEVIQPVMEWLFLSLLHAGYFGQAHLFWLQSQRAPNLEKRARQLYRQGQPILGYR